MQVVGTNRLASKALLSTKLPDITVSLPELHIWHKMGPPTPRMWSVSAGNPPKNVTKRAIPPQKHANQLKISKKYGVVVMRIGFGLGALGTWGPYP